MRGKKLVSQLLKRRSKRFEFKVGGVLVGRIWIAKKVDNEAFKVVLTRVWRTTRGVIFKELDDNIWLFEFEKVDDMREFWKGGLGLLTIRFLSLMNLMGVLLLLRWPSSNPRSRCRFMTCLYYV
jgi:hypothetical protein